jgi:2-keto-4-pentenoate hydratase/2-oxohepta-3-ene-1,7-dioic acid hydratase in catechol pathway
MRVCRFSDASGVQLGFYNDESVISLAAAAATYATATGQPMSLESECLLSLLGPDGEHRDACRQLFAWLAADGSDQSAELCQPIDQVQLLVPIPRPNKLFLLAGNYAKHIEEGGEIAAERAETFPYVFMKPPSTTLTNPGQPIRIPSVNPNSTDYELELAIVIGRGGKGIAEADALGHVAGFTIINDISDRKFRPNSNRKERTKDGFFDWLHGKWHDSFCPCGPCLIAADSVDDPQQLSLQLRVNGELRQDSSTAAQIFPVAAVIEFISSFVTLEPGDIISTGTPDGVGNTTSTYLQPGDEITASIGSIGTLITTVEAE